MASESTMDKMHQMRLSMMARAYREQEEAPGIREMGFDERLAMIVDAEWDARRANKRTRLLRAAAFPEPDANVADVIYDDGRKPDKGQILELLDPVKTKQTRELLEVVESRYRTGSLVLCSQFAPAGWYESLGEGATADAVIDRIVHKSTRIHIEGEESMRKRLADRS